MQSSEDGHDIHECLKMWDYHGILDDVGVPKVDTTSVKLGGASLSSHSVPSVVVCVTMGPSHNSLHILSQVVLPNNNQNFEAIN